MTHFEIIKPRTADELYYRLTDPERSALLASNVQRLEYLRFSTFAADGPPEIEELILLKGRLAKEFEGK